MRRSSSRHAFAIALGLLSCFAQAQQPAYPTRPVRVIVAVAPGGSTDVVARIVSARLAEGFGRPFVVDNRPGAGGVLGNEIVANAQPDGYTLLFTYAGHTIVPFIYSKIPYDVYKDFAPISLVASQAMMLTAHPSVPANSVSELINLAKAKPGFLNAALPTPSSSGALAVELLKIVTSTKMVSVPFKGGAQAITALIGGQVHFIFLPWSTVMPHHAAGRVKVLATTGEARASYLPDVPTMTESGYKDLERQAWQGLLAPAKTPQSIISQLHAQIMQALKIPDVREKLAATGSDIEGTTPAKFAEKIQRELKQNSMVIKAVGMKAD